MRGRLPRPLYDRVTMAIRPALREELLTLSANERRELAEELCESLDDEPLDPAWEQAWSREIQGRMADVADGKVSLVEAEAVHADVRAELGRRRS